ncbi:hypothetical protein GN244_ATG02144 [Phytophthora infestans]|uniref:HTH CENPB-type domain-containing protein n=1 Tax=Phytophthora infestans TaxID=4787 RepID=A0A833TRL7_PHYIN|nr:hypothetical protein GN244_ATG02144 [Phytophthora infestans]KAF4139267.1 hypothetical protein GN958_ATG11483 [Phytophthora infestans]
MHADEPSWSLSMLGRWAEKMFELQKAPAKSFAKRIIEPEAALTSIGVNFLGRKKTPKLPMVALDSSVVEMVLYAEDHHVPISSRLLMIRGRLHADALQIPPMERPMFTHDGWIKNFIRGYGLRHRRDTDKG